MKKLTEILLRNTNRLVLNIGTVLLTIMLCFGSGSVQAETVVALLPMSGTQALAGKEIAKAVQNQLNIKHKLVFVDRYKFPDFATAWQAVMKESPDLVIGPVAMEDVADLLLIHPSVPVIALNRLADSDQNVWQIGLSLEYTAMQLAEVLQEQHHDKILLLLHDSATAERSWKAFLEGSQGQLVDVVSFAKVSELKQASRRLLHTHSGIQRIIDLRAALDNKVEAMPWIRQDADLVLMVSPLNEALELSFRTDYLWDQNMNIYWLDSGQQPVQDFVSSSVNWGRMKTLMSPYLVRAMQRSGDVQPEQNFFRALGHDSALLANLVFNQADKQLMKEDGVAGWLGKLTLQSGGKIGIGLSQVGLGGGNIQVTD
jgi:hypothetical protein